ncbi:MAG: DUF488 family protein [Geminicoccaceae bacterium]
MIFTIGHSTRPAEVFLDLLGAHGVRQIADVRTVPKSRRHPQFGKEALEAALHARGMTYRHFPALGGLRKPSADSINTGWRHSGFRGYADHMQTDAFRLALDDLLAFAEGGTTAVMCAEAVWWQCHRMLISDALAARAVNVDHIVNSRGATAVQRHRLTPFARIEAPATRDAPPRVWYPGLV